MVLIGEILQRARESCGITKIELARRSGVDVGSISRLERGQASDPRLSTLAALAAGLGLGDGTGGVTALLSVRLPRRRVP